VLLLQKVNPHRQDRSARDDDDALLRSFDFDRRGDDLGGDARRSQRRRRGRGRAAARRLLMHGGEQRLVVGVLGEGEVCLVPGATRPAGFLAFVRVEACVSVGMEEAVYKRRLRLGD
jgi:hypothetical protein